MSNFEPDDYLRVPAIRVEQPLGEFFAVAIPANKLLQISYSDQLTAVLQGDTYGLDGSQRGIKEERLKEIGRYINTIEAAFPNSVILAANYDQEDGLGITDSTIKWRIEPRNGEEDCLQLIVPTANKVAPIIDGQHRLFGFTKAVPERLSMPVLCSVFMDLPRPYQAYLFATINSTQRPVDRSQTYELFGYNIDEEPAETWSPEKLAVFLTRKLNTDGESPLYRRILVAAENDFSISRAEARAQGRWMVSTATIVDGITRLISRSPRRDADELRTGSDHRRSKLPHDGSPLRELYLAIQDKVLLAAVSNFFSALLDVGGRNLSTGSYLTKTVGMQALFDVLRELAPVALQQRDFSKDWFVEVISPINQVDFAHHEFQQASGQGRSLIRNAILLLLGMLEVNDQGRREEIEGIVGRARWDNAQ